MTSVHAAFRDETILAALERSGWVRAKEVAARLGVSAVTIRSDLQRLEQAGLLRRTRGGAVVVAGRRLELPLEATRRMHSAEKARIGRYAAGLVSDGQTVILDVGSTATELARALPLTVRDVIIVTSALNIALMLESHPGVKVVVTGGTLRVLQHSLVNPFGTLLLEHLNAHLAFLGCNGIHPERGITNANLEEAEIKRAMIRCAANTVVLADHSKLMEVATAPIVPIGQIGQLITGEEASPEHIAALEAAGMSGRIALV